MSLAACPDSNAGLALALTVASLLFAAPAVHAQLVNGFISGTVTDQQKSADFRKWMSPSPTRKRDIPQTKKTDEEGYYRFVAVPPGIYSRRIQEIRISDLRSAKDIIVTTSAERTIDQPIESWLVRRERCRSVRSSKSSLSRTSANIQMTLPGRTLDLTPLATSSLVSRRCPQLWDVMRFSHAGVVRVAGQNEFSTNGHRGRENNFMMDGVRQQRQHGHTSGIVRAT